MNDQASGNESLRHVTKFGDISSTDLRPLYDQKWALIVGIDSYQWYEERYHLKHAVADARGVAELLKREYGFPENKVFLLCNQEATRDNIRAKLIDIIAGEAGRDDCVLIFFACHGEKRETADGKSHYYLSAY